MAFAVTCLATGTLHAAERRCGWYLNPTPGNLILADRDADWWITSQMQANGPDAAGLDKAPDFDEHQYVSTQPNGHGYGCACLTVQTNAKDQRITRIYAGKILPLAKCRKDPGLKSPDGF